MKEQMKKFRLCFNINCHRHISFRALVALELLVSVNSQFSACSARISGDRHTDQVL